MVCRSHFSVVLSTVLILKCIHAQLTWIQIDQPNGPSPRQGAGLGYASQHQFLVMFGGKSNAQIMNDTWIFRFANSTAGYWEELQVKTAPPPRFSYVSGSLNDSFYIATGEGPNKRFYNDVWKFDFNSEMWEELLGGGSKPENRYGAAGGIHPDSTVFYVAMGFSGRRYSNTYSYNLAGRVWNIESKGYGSYSRNGPHARCLIASAMVSHDEMVIYGGCQSGGGTGGSCPSGESWKYSASLHTWTRIQGCASPRQLASMAMLPEGAGGERRAVMYGGRETGRQVLLTRELPADELSLLDPSTDTWSLIKSAGDIPDKMFSVAMTTSRDGIYLFGGQNIGRGGLSGNLYLLAGDARVAEDSPPGGSCNPPFFNLPALHGIFMFMAWGVLLPGGIFIARHLRHKDPLWFKLHRFIQVSGVILATVGLLCAIVSVKFAHFKFVHGGLGLAIMLLGFQQPINAFFRPHVPADGKDKPRKRIVWEWFHRGLGASAVLLATINISLGVFLIMAHDTIIILWFVYLALLVTAFIAAEVRKHYKH